MGKGSSPRPILDKVRFENEFDRIFGPVRARAACEVKECSSCKHYKAASYYCSWLDIKCEPVFYCNEWESKKDESS